MKKFLLFTLLFQIGLVYGQSKITVIADNLKGPIGIEKDNDGNLWVSESGTGNSDAGVTIIWNDGTITKVIDSLPSVVNTIEGGFTGAEQVSFIDENYVAVFALLDTVFGTHGVIIFDRKAILNSKRLTYNDNLAIYETYKNVPKLGHVESHSFGIILDGCDWLIADAAANAIVRKDALSGAYSDFANFPSQPNPTPVGGPFIEFVPTKILANPDGGYYVSHLSGFPFLDKLASVVKVNEQGQVSKFHDSLTLVTDMELDPDGDGVLALQLGQYRLGQQPPFLFNSSAIIHLQKNGTKDTIVSGFGPSPGMALGDTPNSFYVTHLFFGQVLKVEKMTTALQKVDVDQSNLMVYPNPTSKELIANIYLEKSQNVVMEILDLKGSLLSKQVIPGQKGENDLNVSLQNLPITNGLFILKVSTLEGVFNKKVLLQN